MPYIFPEEYANLMKDSENKNKLVDAMKKILKNIEFGRKEHAYEADKNFIMVDQIKFTAQQAIK